MQREQCSEFSGVAGRVLDGSISGSSLISGIVLGVVLVLGSAAFVFGGVQAMVMPFGLLVLGFALARFAVNGLSGEWGGTVFSDAGGPWGDVVPVALRYLTLTLIWYVPLAVIGMIVTRSASATPTMSPTGMITGALVVGAINMLATTLTPPLFLIVSVSAREFGEIFSGDLWRRQFAGRLADLSAIYAVYTGALFMVAMLSLPLILLVGAASWKLAIVLGGASFCLLFGVSVNLLGRLCGFFASGELGLKEPDHAVDAVPLPTPAPTSDPGATMLANDPVAQPIPSFSLPTVPASDKATIPAVPAPTSTPVPDHAATMQQPAPGVQAAGPAKRPPLADAKKHVTEAVRGFDQDPQVALLALYRLSEEYQPNPVVLQALAVYCYRSGRIEDSLQAANEAMPMCLERGHSFLAAEIFRDLRQHRSRLGLKREQMLTIGNTLVKMEDFATAAKAYSAVIADDNSETRAIKGLLQVADSILHQKQKPEAAVKVYRYLLQNCATSPLAEYMQTGLEEAERNLAHAPTAS